MRVDIADGPALRQRFKRHPHGPLAALARGGDHIMAI